MQLVGYTDTTRFINPRLSRSLRRTRSLIVFHTLRWKSTHKNDYFILRQYRPNTLRRTYFCPTLVLLWAVHLATILDASLILIGWSCDQLNLAHDYRTQTKGYSTPSSCMVGAVTGALPGEPRAYIDLCTRTSFYIMQLS